MKIKSGLGCTLKIKRVIGISFFLILSCLTLPMAASWTDQFLKNKFHGEDVKVNFLDSLKNLSTNENQRMIFLCLEILFMVFICYSLFKNTGASKIGLVKVTDDIYIPKTIGQGQHGTSRFLSDKEKERMYKVLKYKGQKINTNENIGLVLQMKKKLGYEKILYINDDRNSIIIGATRSGKTRRLLMLTIWLRAKAGKSMVITDAKGELYCYFQKYLRELDYNVIKLDYRNPDQSDYYNYMEQINNYVNDQDIPKAIESTWDLVSMLVGEPKGEPLWTNGEAATIAACILYISLEGKPKYKNLTNIYYFLGNMAKTEEDGEMRISKLLKTLPLTHPARSVFDVAEISPEKMRGSFFGMALTTLRLFTDMNISEMSSKSDIDINSIGERKTVVFIIAPDEKTTRYPLISLAISQIYNASIETANKHGGRLPIEIDFNLDEFGNFPAIPSCGAMVSAGLSRGIRFNFVIQAYQQMEKRYKDEFSNIKANCKTTIFLNTAEPKTEEEISKRTGTYTTQTNSMSFQDKTLGGLSSSTSMQQRALLTPDEVGRIKPPYALVFDQTEHKQINILPDISHYRANKELGLGSKEHNIKLIEETMNNIPRRKVVTPLVWDVWKEFTEGAYYIDEDKENISVSDSDTISFLD